MLCVCLPVPLSASLAYVSQVNKFSLGLSMTFLNFMQFLKSVSAHVDVKGRVLAN